MPQKPLLKAGKKIDKGKKQAANRHGKAVQTKKGAFSVTPKNKKLSELDKDKKGLTKIINATNEANAATMASNAGGRLHMVKAAPPVLAPADQKKRAKSKAKEEDLEL